MQPFLIHDVDVIFNADIVVGHVTVVAVTVALSGACVDFKGRTVGGRDRHLKIYGRRDRQTKSSRVEMRHCTYKWGKKSRAGNDLGKATAGPGISLSQQYVETKQKPDCLKTATTVSAFFTQLLTP